ncbi:hypothetical protein GGR53DRAFT_156088 [Hypoxylon sp. FL1150]|nr:hypothetical protein GGR53DRAFT_156088 [Hypoxylon sp. FL1150]
MTDNKLSSNSTLHVYHTRYSSWGARVALVIAYFQIPCIVKFYTLRNPANAPPARLTGRFLPVLEPDAKDKTFVVADSLAICEYLAEQNPDRPLWPRDRELRALARTAAAEMHSGFGEVRGTYHTNFLGRYTGKVPISEAAAREIRRIVELWGSARAAAKKRLRELGEQDEGFLFGAFSIADAFFWPVLWRFRSYQLPLTGISEDGLAWVAKMWNDPAIKAEIHGYFVQAQDPMSRVEHYEDIFKDSPDVEYGQFCEDWTFDASRV